MSIGKLTNIVRRWRNQQPSVQTPICPPIPPPERVCPSCGGAVGGSARRRYCRDGCRVLAWYQRNRESYLARQCENPRTGRWL